MIFWYNQGGGTMEKRITHSQIWLRAVALAILAAKKGTQQVIEVLEEEHHMHQGEVC
jgi:hypothetical protein